MRDYFVSYPYEVTVKEEEENKLGFNNGDSKKEGEKKSGKIGFWISTVLRLWEDEEGDTILEFNTGDISHIIVGFEEFIKTHHKYLSYGKFKRLTARRTFIRFCSTLFTRKKSQAGS
jgi:hypothetical protein